MLNRMQIAILFIAINSIMTGAWGQNVFKCGNSYSQQPCTGGAAVDVADPRTSAQKKESDMANQRNAKAASSMEKSRLQREKAELQAVSPVTKPGKAKAARSSEHTGALEQPKPVKKPKPQQQQDFNAQVPVDLDDVTKKTKPKKPAVIKDEVKP